MAQRHLVTSMSKNCVAFDHRRLETDKMDLLDRQIATRPNSIGKSHSKLRKLFPPHGCVVNGCVRLTSMILVQRVGQLLLCSVKDMQVAY